jgi:hypothetical protein
MFRMVPKSALYFAGAVFAGYALGRLGAPLAMAPGLVLPPHLQLWTVATAPLAAASAVEAAAASLVAVALLPMLETGLGGPAGVARVLTAVYAGASLFYVLLAAVVQMAVPSSELLLGRAGGPAPLVVALLVAFAAFCGGPSRPPAVLLMLAMRPAGGPGAAASAPPPPQGVLAAAAAWLGAHPPPASAFLWAYVGLTAALAVAGWSLGAAEAALAVPVAWLYLRFVHLQRDGQTRGDRNPDFEFAKFFPEPLAAAVAPLEAALVRALVAVGAVPPSVLLPVSRESRRSQPPMPQLPPGMIPQNAAALMAAYMGSGGALPPGMPPMPPGMPAGAPPMGAAAVANPAAIPSAAEAEASRRREKGQVEVDQRMMSSESGKQ